MKLIASLSMFAFMFVVTADSWTSTTERYITGQLESRLIELGTNKQSGDYNAQWRAMQEYGVRKHCARTLHAQGKADPKCGNAFSR